MYTVNNTTTGNNTTTEQLTGLSTVTLGVLILLAAELFEAMSRLVDSPSVPGALRRSRGSGTVPGPCAVEAVRATRPRVQPPHLSPDYTPVQVVPSVVVMDAAAALLGPRMEMHATTKHLEGTRVREGGAAFGRLAELATRKSARVLVKQSQNQLVEANHNQLCSTSLPRQPFSSRQPCSYSRQWLLTHRAHCGGSPLRPSQQEPRLEARTLRLPNHANHAPEARAKRLVQLVCKLS